jgi:hypothetical protein
MVVYIHESKMVSVRNGQQVLCSVCLFTLVVGSYPYVGNYRTDANDFNADFNEIRVSLPDNIATILNTSLLQKNSALVINIFAS